ncbi:MAG: hypothetical protein R3E84_21025 [Pseudomonadales bacterium]
MPFAAEKSFIAEIGPASTGVMTRNMKSAQFELIGLMTGVVSGAVGKAHIVASN